jgi:toxin CcdB
MAQFDLYRNPGPRTSKQAPYLVEVQGRFVESLATCVVIPLVEQRYFTGASVLNPLIPVNGTEYYLSTAEITAVPRSLLGRSLGSALAHRTEIIAAIDRLLM